MIDYSNADIVKLSVHHVGNKTNGDALHISKTPLQIPGARERELLFRFFLTPFTLPEFYSFTFSNDDFTLNPLYGFAAQIFDNPRNFHRHSADTAKHLFEASIHPQIKAGDLFVAYFSNLCVEDEVADAIGIFKSENRQAFLKLDLAGEDIKIEYEDGINTERLDKGCLIFNTGKDKGYKVCVIDKSSRSGEAQFWKDSFLQLKPCSDEFHFTKKFLDITRNYVTRQMDEEFEVSKADKIDLLNRSVEYFKTRDNFVQEEFETEVLQDSGIINSFRSFDTSYREKNDIPAADSFEISTQAVKKQERIFKSVLKLDKNFHIYIHGNRNLIEQGVEKDGRKFYKIYFEEEA
jgi:hypothetical protein